jgi:hypothetical protein
VDEHPGSQDRLRQVGVQARTPGERDEQVKSGRDALDAGRGEVLAQRPQQGIAPAPLSLADTPDVLLEFAARDQPGQCELRQRRAAQVAGALASPRSACSRPGGISQPRRMPGASVLEVLPA